MSHQQQLNKMEPLSVSMRKTNKGSMMKKVGLLIAVLLSFAPLAPAAVVVDVNDRPYYIHGPGYYIGHVYYVWVPGHWARRHGQRVWIHGHYAPR